ncbi:alpha-1,2-fucosyltransferase [Oceanospirillaceae bacterium]|nr:alpha-1,2-fucosyltransferase [Oceanospirillaceae bacterium]
MFQYAFAYSVSRDNNTELRLDIDGFDSYDLRDYELRLYGINDNTDFEFKYKSSLGRLQAKNENFVDRIARTLLIKLLGFSKSFHHEKKESAFDEDVFNVEVDTYFYGYWQNEKYFKKYRKDLLEIFILKNIHAKTIEYQQQIIKREAVSLHIRRGDYVTDAHTNSVHGTCDVKYYKKAVMEVLKSKKQAHFFIFSDDLDWAENNLDFIVNKTFIRLESDVPDHEEMYLMSQCKHNIIANSSFSWWGAWLNKNSQKIVIAPKKWFNNSKSNQIVPHDWIKI